METQQIDDFADDGAVVDHRARMRSKLDEIAQQVKAALTEQGLDFDLFFLVPHSGDSLLSFGTMADADDASWGRVDEIVCSVVAQTVGLRRTRTRPVMCTSTDTVAMPIPILVPPPIFAGGEAP